jgi:hypothetical protein
VLLVEPRQILAVIETADLRGDGGQARLRPVPGQGLDLRGAAAQLLPELLRPGGARQHRPDPGDHDLFDPVAGA